MDGLLCWIGRFTEDNSYLRLRRHQPEAIAEPVPTIPKQIGILIS
jgi:hypothetical protein